MRGLAVLALFALMGLGALFVLGPPEAAELESGVADLRSSLTGSADEGALRAAPTARTPRSGESGSASTFYQYTDEQGGIHFVQSAGDVPARYRKSADTLEVTNEIIRPDPPSAPPAARRPEFAYEPEPRRARASSDVVIYTAPWCGWCRKTLAWLDARGVDYDNRDIEADPSAREELIAKSGSTSIPVVEVDGQLIRGYSPAKMQHLLEL